MSKNNSSIHLSPSEEKALRYILKTGPTYAYHLSHGKTKKFNTEKTANIALNSLSRKGLLEKKGIEGERNRKDYYLTSKGMCAVLTFSTELDEFWVKIESIIEKWGSLLPILSKWHLFKKHGLEDYFKDILKRAALISITPELTVGSWNSQTQSYESIPEPAENFNYKLEMYLIEESISIGYSGDADFMMKWNRVLHEDADLRKKTKILLERNVRMREQYLTDWKERLSAVFPELERSDPDWDGIRAIELNLQRAHIIL